MAKNVVGPEIERLIQLLAKLPGLGPRSARRAALHLIKKRDQLLLPLATALDIVGERVMTCEVCGNVDTKSPCTICSDPARDRTTAIVVETISDLWALEKASASRGVYHILGGVLSPLDGVGPDELNIQGLVNRCADGEIREVILAIGATVEGQTTAHYLADALKGVDVRITRLAHGVPVGGELEYLDEGTLSAAMRARNQL